MPRIPFADLLDALSLACQRLGFAPERAQLCARLFAEATRDGVYTHGLNRFGRMAAMVKNGCIDVNAEPTLAGGFGALERWEGNMGPGNLNAHASMQRAITLAREHGIGAVALAHTNHWMRGGSYGWQAADQGLFAMCWTNTGRNLPGWGTTEATLGNNPLILAVPREGGHVVLDMAMSQFSFGQIDAHAKRGDRLPVPGGYDVDGNLTHDPAAIQKSNRALPIGFWKGSGLSLTLDLFAAMLSGGKATHQISKDSLKECSLSQFFLAIDPSNIAQTADLNRIADDLIEALHAAPRTHPDKRPRYPGEETLRLREENLRLGVPVEEDAWQQLLRI